MKQYLGYMAIGFTGSAVCWYLVTFHHIAPVWAWAIGFFTGMAAGVWLERT